MNCPDVTNTIWKLVLAAPKRLVLLAMAEYANDGNHTAPSMGLIAWKTGYSDRQVQRIVKALTDDKLLVIAEERAGKSTVYRIDTAAGEQKEAFTSDKMTPLTYVKMSEVDYRGDDADEATGDNLTPKKNESSLLDFDLVSEVSSAPAHEDPPPPAAPLPEKSNLLALWEHPFVAAWWSATPPDKRLTGIDARAGQTIADLTALGASADDVTGLVTDKFKQPRTEYRFGWLVEDMPAYRAQRQFAAAPPKPTGVWAITELPPEREAPDYTPEQRQKLIEDGRRLRGEMLRQFDYAARVGG